MNKAYSKRILLLPIAVIFAAVLVTGVSALSINSIPVSKLIASVDSEFVLSLSGYVVDQPVNTTITYSIVDKGGFDRFQMNLNTGEIRFTPLDGDEGRHIIKINATASNATGTIASASTDLTFYVTTESCDNKAITVTLNKNDIEDVTGDSDEIKPGDNLDLVFDATAGSKLVTDVKAKIWLEKLAGGRVGSKVETEQDDIDGTTEMDATFRVDPSALESSHILFVKISGTDDDTGDDVCGITAYYPIQVKRDSHELLMENTAVNPATAVCNGRTEISATVYNIGDSTEDDIRMRVRNSELNLDVSSPMFELKKSGSSAKVVKSVLFNIPASAKGTYNFEVSMLFNGGSDSTVQFIDIPVTCGTTGTTQPGITGATISLPTTMASAESGQIVKFIATIRNTETTAQNYQVAISGTSDWAASSLEPSDITLAPGAEMPVYIYLTPRSSVYGDQTATLSIKSASTVLATKTLTVSLPQKPVTTVTQKSSSTSPMADIELSDEAKVAAIVGLALIVAGFLYMKYRAGREGIKVYGKKGRGRKAAPEEL